MSNSNVMRVCYFLLPCEYEWNIFMRLCQVQIPCEYVLNLSHASMDTCIFMRVWVCYIYFMRLSLMRVSLVTISCEYVIISSPCEYLTALFFMRVCLIIWPMRVWFSMYCSMRLCYFLFLTMLVSDFLVHASMILPIL